ncbi:MATE family efflux transporter, partial [Klebsiella pneumoniae]|uniref:MATE family efflux transporter n=1 Tax=Klebsiella pneumoniae TaxID=573 RepID=UPI00214BD3A9
MPEAGDYSERKDKNRAIKLRIAQQCARLVKPGGTIFIDTGTSIWLPAILFGHGLLLALTPVVAQLNGSGRRERIAPQVRQG